MNLKESYRYANYLDGLLSTAYTYLRNKGFVTTTVEEHLRKQSNPDVENEIIDAGYVGEEPRSPHKACRWERYPYLLFYPIG